MRVDDVAGNICEALLCGLMVQLLQKLSIRASNG